MEPANFPEQNVIYGNNQQEYLPLPAFKTDEGEVITCWDLSDEDLEKIQRTGRVYLSQLTFNQPLQAVLLSVDKPKILCNPQKSGVTITAIIKDNPEEMEKFGKSMEDNNRYVNEDGTEFKVKKKEPQKEN